MYTRPHVWSVSRGGAKRLVRLAAAVVGAWGSLGHDLGLREAWLAEACANSALVVVVVVLLLLLLGPLLLRPLLLRLRLLVLLLRRLLHSVAQNGPSSDLDSLYITYGYSLYYIWLQPLLHMVTASST
jgi:hypothetical protein